VGHQRSANSSPHWIHRIEGRTTDDVVASRGTIFEAGRTVDYYTTQPSAAQWIALGVVPLVLGLEDTAEGTHRVVVGTGSTELEAVESLRARLSPALSMPLVDSFALAAQPSDWFG
jgi:hypothetical protein